MSELNLCMQQNIQGTEKQFLLKETSFKDKFNPFGFVELYFFIGFFPSLFLFPLWFVIV